MARRPALASPGEPPSRPDPRGDRSGGVALWSPDEGGVARPDDRAGGYWLWAVTPCGADPRAVRVGARAPDAPGEGHPVAVPVRREKARSFSGCKSRPDRWSLHQVAA